MDKHFAETALKLSDGSSRRVLFCMGGLIHAEERHGYSTEALEMDPDKAQQDVNAVKHTRRLRLMLERVWIGCLMFEPDLSFDTLAMAVQTQEDMAEVVRVFVHTLKYQSPKPQEGKKKAKAAASV